MEYSHRDAELSKCETYRYTLRRFWDVSKHPVVFCLLNPSTANADLDDPTIRRVVRYGLDWGYGGVVVVNLFAYRATDPRLLLTAGDPVGPDNDRHLYREAAGRDVVCGWGANADRFPERAGAVLKILRSAGRTHLLGMTSGGHPRHPLYLKASLKPVPWPEGGKAPADTPTPSAAGSPSRPPTAESPDAA